ncbi:MAG: ABC transporter ATP-binding protein [Candidatus Marinimicrobia bacterium]|nr:ABC transporter ATP-binding protein [Candidatus Neomarinimicrobiota bacterium]MCF7840007.1 ABC transporter ATP-binding protein [Candidatus Neomarinimicrobiota bacterium]
MAVSITLRNITKKFGPVTAVNNLSFGVEHGTIFSIVGPSGSGKSTLLKIMATMVRPSQGSGYVNGQNLTARPIQIRQQIGYMGQQVVLDEQLTVLENFVFHSRLHGISDEEAEARILGLAERFNLMDGLHQLPDGLAYGIKRKIQLMRTLLTHPSILLLDEPTRSMDRQTALAIWEYLREQRSRLTIVMITSSMAEVEHVADRLIIMDHGHILVDGSVEAVLHAQQPNQVLEARVNEINEAEYQKLTKSELVLDFSRHENVYAIVTRYQTSPSKILQLFDAENIISFMPKKTRLADAFIHTLSQEQIINE